MKIKLGHSFATPILVVCIFISVCGLIMCVTEPIAGVITVIISTFFWSNTYGFELDKDSNKYREYSSVFGLKSGKWKSLDKLPNVTILPVKEGMTVYSSSNRATSSTKTSLGIYLLSNTHRTKVLMCKCSDKESAKKYLNTFSTDLKKEIVQYNPVVSEKTKMRRRR